jgi:hypothetical protein
MAWNKESSQSNQLYFTNPYKNRIGRLHKYQEKNFKKTIFEVDEMTEYNRAQYQCLKTKVILQNIKTRRGEILTINNQDIEVVRISMYTYFKSCNQ